MAVQTDATLKTYFETGDQPTEAQFVDFIDSKRNVDDTISPTEITGYGKLPDCQKHILASGGTIDLEAEDLIIQMVVLSGAAGNITVEIVSDSYKFIDDQTFTNGEYEILVDPYFANVPKTITVTGNATIYLIVGKFA